MKILAVRGANLASLEGKFEIVLDEGPLADAGVFVICGPTGAGKSTLLDAMCLALFDDAPRLDGAGRVRVGREGDDEGERITTSDPRSLLRKGAGRGFAEVDFEGVDGQRYRARWEAHRARDRADGKLQPTSRSLVDLGTEHRVSGRKGDVKEAIEERLGLSFEQFRRSVLLAQGDFAAFLDADARNRADLLERMTGTEIYGLISQEAHARAGEERRQLDLLEERLRAVRVLEPEERALLDEETESLARRVHEDALLAHDADAAVRWHAELASLKREERDADEERKAVEAQLALAETKRIELAAVQAAAPLRPRVERLDRAREMQSARAAKLEEAERAALAAAADAEAKRTARAEAEAAALRAEAEREGRRAALDRARALDDALGPLRERAEAATRARAEAAEEAEGAARTHAELTGAIARHRADAERAREWLEAHPAAAALVADRARSEERLARLRGLVAEEERAENALVGHRANAGAAELALARAEGGLRGATARRRELELEYEALREAVRREPSSALGDVHGKWTLELAALEALSGLADRAQAAQQAERRARERAEKSDASADAADQLAARADSERGGLEGRVAEAQHQRDALRATLDLSERRAELVDGEPCPLCGSEEHPYAHEAPLLSALLEAADERLGALRTQLTALDVRAAEARQAAVAHRRAAAQAREDAATEADALAEARALYAAKAASIHRTDEAWPQELPQTPVDLAAPTQPDWGPLFELARVAPVATGPLLSSDARDAIAAARDEAREKLQDLHREAAERARRERHAERAHRRFEDARTDEGAARDAHVAAQAAAIEAARDLRDATEALAQVRAQRERGARELSAVLDAFEGWEARLRAAPAAFVDEVRRAVEERAAGEAALRLAQDEAQRLEPTVMAAAAELRSAERALEASENARKAVSAELDARAAERAGVLDGESAAAVEARLKHAVEAARAQARQALEVHGEAARVSVERASQRERARDAVDEAGAELDEAGRHLLAALHEAGLEEAGARERLARDPAEVESWRRELADLDSRRAKLTAVCIERTRKRASHEETDPPRLDADGARDALASATRRLADTRDLLAATKSRVAQDDENRRRAEEARVERAAQRERLQVWESLAELIGSASGGKLRVFAQSLTLELLLEHANLHLCDLAPRYGLARVPGEDLALQVVDHEMGDDVRSVESLSGGESFLVALGMALGLASLSSQKTRVSSLFIDEGFGALDPSSLEMVLSTLDQLQSTGRQVGLISHVQTVAERFDTRVEVAPAGPARSRVRLVEGPG